MGHHEVWNSHPCKFSKGGREWCAVQPCSCSSQPGVGLTPLCVCLQPGVQQPVGPYQEVRPQHLQAVLQGVRQGHRLHQGACLPALRLRGAVTLLLADHSAVLQYR